MNHCRLFAAAFPSSHPDPLSLFLAAGMALLSISPAAQGAEALFVVGAIPLNAGDAAVQARLESHGLTVIAVQAAASQTSDADGKALVLSSSTVSSGEVLAKFRTVPVPVINWEQALQDDYALTGNSGTDRGEATAQTSVDVVDAGHPMSGGLAAGAYAVYSSPQTMTWGLPNANAVVIATFPGNQNRACLYGYDTGAEMIGGFVAPARRVHVFLQDLGAANLTEEGGKLLDGAILWALGVGAPVTISELTPGKGTMFHPASSGLRFNAASSEPISAEGIQLILDGSDVSDGLAVSGPETDRAVTYGGLAPNRLYTGSLTVSNALAMVTIEVSFDTFDLTQTMIVESEDYNFGPDAGCSLSGDPFGDTSAGGGYLQNPDASDFVGGGYVNKETGYVDRLGIPGIDFSDTTTTGADLANGIYRFCDPVGTQAAGDVVRAKHAAVGVMDYAVWRIQPQEWLNYTRSYSGNYRLYLRVAAAAPQRVILSRVTSDRSLADQETVVLGAFDVAGGNVYRYVPLIDATTGQPLVLALSGVQTLRLTSLGASNDLRLNYLAAAPTSEAANVVGPWIQARSPEADAVGVPRATPIEVAIQNRSTAVSASSIVLSVDGQNVTAATLIEPAAEGVLVRYERPGGWDIGATHSVAIAFADTEGNPFSAQWSFEAATDTEGPRALSAHAGAIQNGGMRVRVKFSEAVDLATALAPANYTANLGLSIVAVEASDLDSVMVLDTQGAMPNTTYVLTVRDVGDRFGNPMAQAAQLMLTPGPASLNEGLVFWYELDEAAGMVVNDSSPNGWTGTIADATWTTGIWGGALQFDGVDDYFELDLLFTPPPQGTVAFWMNYTPLTRTQRPLGGHDAYEIQIDPAMKVRNQLFQGGSDAMIGLISLVPERWHHVVSTYDFNTHQAEIYIDGVLDSSALLADDDPGTFALRVGVRTASTEFFRGKLDDIRQYDRVLALEEIAALAGVEPNRAPIVSITAPADESVFPVGASVTLTAAALDDDGVITRVEFFRGDEKLGEAVAAPFSFSWTDAPAGRHLITAVAHDDGGLTATSAAIQITVGAPPVVVVLLVVPNSDTLNASDAGVKARLESFGFEVIALTASVSSTADANDKSLIIVSSTISSGQVSTKFRDVPVPVINWEQALQDEFQLTLDSAAGHGETGGLTDLIIVNANHPLAAGLAQGTHSVTTSAQTFTWGRPSTETAVVIATLANGTDNPCIYAYEKGALLINGTTAAPERRVHIFFQDNAFANLTPAGLQLFDAAVNWAMDRSSPRPEFEPVSLGNGTVTLSWTGGGVLQQADTVRGPWTDVLGASSPYSAPTEGVTARFFRIVQ